MTELAIVGGGPAGLHAALSSADAGATVLLIDSAPRLGGQYLRRSAATLGEPTGAAAEAADLFRAVEGHPRVEVRSGTTVWAGETIDGGFRLHLRPTSGPGTATGAGNDTTGAGHATGAEPGTGVGATAGVPATTGAGSSFGAAPTRYVDVPAVVVATGAYDRALPFPGWDLPGVMTAGGMQALLKGNGVVAGDRIALSGTGPFLLPVAAALAEAGARVVGVFEAGNPGAWLRRLPTVAGHPGKVREGADYLRILRRYGVPVRFRHAVVAAHGDDRITAATAVRLSPQWTVIEGTARRLEVDAIGLGYGFVPVVDLALALGATADTSGGLPRIRCDPAQRAGVPGLFAAGELTGIGGAALASAEGTLAGLAAAAGLGYRIEGRADEALRERARHRRFAEALAAAYPVRSGWITWPRGDTVICRCEEVRLSTVQTAISGLSATDLRAVKLTTRTGMGFCQGRICGPAVADLVRAQTGRPPTDPLSLSTRPLTVPVPLGELASGDQD